jgi:hypothetical protein
MKRLEPMTQTAAGRIPLRRFVATRISQAIEPDLRADGRIGSVEGVHRSAVNIRWGDRLVTVAHESTGGLPNGILVDPPIALDQIGITMGMRVECDGIALRVPAASIAVLLTVATGWSPSMPVVHGTSIRELGDRAERALGLAADQVPPLGLGPLLVALADRDSSVGSLGRAAASSLADVVQALRDGAPERAMAAAMPLIGLGPGATPSGDDLLVGLTAGLGVTAHPLAVDFAAGVARGCAGLTTSVAESYLLHAGRLEFSERVHAAALAVVSGPEADLPNEVTAALAWGASSGADLLVGLLIGIQASAPGLAARLRACADERHVAA